MAINVLVTGGSGGIGSQVVQQLLALGHGTRVSVLEVDTPRTRRKLAPLQGRVRPYLGDIRDPDLVLEACRGQQVVIHLAAVIPPLADEQPELARSVNVEGTRNVVEALEAQDDPAFLLYSSSVAVYGDRLADPDIVIDDPLQPSVGDDYARTKIDAERIVRGSGLAWSIFRLSAIFGIGTHQPTGLMFHMPLATPIEFTTVEDAARAFVRAIRHRDGLERRTFNLGGGAGCRIRYDDFLERSFEATGLGALTFPDHAFAERNFHCGYYADGDELERLLAFRRDDVERYFQRLRDSVPVVQRGLAAIARPFVRRQLLSRSEPLRAVRRRDEAELERFFSPATVQRVLTGS